VWRAAGTPINRAKQIMIMSPPHQETRVLNVKNDGVGNIYQALCSPRHTTPTEDAVVGKISRPRPQPRPNPTFCAETSSGKASRQESH